MKNLNRKWILLIFLLSMVLAILACGQTAPATPAGPTPTTGPLPTPTLRPYVPMPKDTGPKYDISQISQGAKDTAEPIVRSREGQNAFTFASAAGLGSFAVLIWAISLILGMLFLSDNSNGGAISTVFYVALSVSAVLAIVIGVIVNTNISSGIPDKVSKESYALQDYSRTDGVAVATRMQSVNDQYIYASIIAVVKDAIPCQMGDKDYIDFCEANTPYYNHWTTEYACGTDSNGHTEYCDEAHYVNWFTEIDRYGVILGTKAKYLDEQIYHQKCATIDDTNGKITVFECHRDQYGQIDDNDKTHYPIFYLHADWRAPEDIASHTQTESGIFGLGSKPVDIGQYNNHVPQDWANVRDASKSCNAGQTYCATNIVATVVGPYFNYAFAAGSPLFDPQTFDYQNLLKLAVLPTPHGAAFPEKDPFGKDSILQTSLYGIDSDLPMHLDPITVVGTCLDPKQIADWQKYAIQLQGDFGPTKQGSLRWYLVCDNIVQSLGGIQNAVAAFKGYDRDPIVQGNFSMPQNLVGVVESVSMDGKCVTARGMYTGIPAGNDQVQADMLDSIKPGECVPFTKENVIGKFESGYIGSTQMPTDISLQQSGTSTAIRLKYSYGSMPNSGGAVGILYATDPHYVPPDPSDPKCEIPKFDHSGFVRYSMCNFFYEQSSIQVKQEGYDLIMSDVTAKAIASVDVLRGWVLALIALVVAVVSIATRVSKLSDDLNKSNSYRHYRY